MIFLCQQSSQIRFIFDELLSFNAVKNYLSLSALFLNILVSYTVHMQLLATKISCVRVNQHFCLHQLQLLKQQCFHVKTRFNLCNYEREDSNQTTFCRKSNHLDVLPWAHNMTTALQITLIQACKLIDTHSNYCL